MGHGLTLNLGVRFDKEHVPTFVEGNPGISFGFGDKVAPRLGAAWDVMRNGKLKLYGSFGYFYDIMKYELPRGSFGGDYWHDCVYAVDDPNIFTSIVPIRGSDGHYCPRTGEATGNITGARFIANEDFRLPVNDSLPGSHRPDRSSPQANEAARNGDRHRLGDCAQPGVGDPLVAEATG